MHLLIWSTCAGLRAGLAPLHPALRAPDVRQALVAQHRLHSSIFGSRTSNGWVTKELGRLWEGLHPDPSYDLAAQASRLELGIFYLQVLLALCVRDALALPCLERLGRLPPRPPAALSIRIPGHNHGQVANV